jgi:hypothetical protein
MARRHTSGFDVLGFESDPTPGDPDIILNQIVPAYKSIGDDAQTAVSALRGNAMQAGTGATMDKLREVIGSKYPPKLQQTADSFHSAAQVYQTYAQSLSDAQSQLDTAMDQAGQVSGTANTLASLLPVNATPDQQAAAQSQRQAIQDANDQLTAAKRLGQDAKDLRDQAGTTFNKNLRAVSTVPSRSAFQKFLDFFEHSPLIQILIDVAIAIVTVFVPVAGLALGALALGVTTALNTVATGHFDAGAFVVGLAGLAVGGVGALAKFSSTAAGFLDGAASKIGGIGKLFQSTPTPAATGILGTAKKVATDFGVGFGINFGISAGVGVVGTGVKDALSGQKFTGTQVADIFGGAAVAGALGGASKAGEGQIFKDPSLPPATPPKEPPPVPPKEPPPVPPKGDEPVTPAGSGDKPLPPRPDQDKPLPPTPGEVPSFGNDSLGHRAFDGGSGLVQNLGGGLADVGIAVGLGDDDKDKDGDTGEALGDAADTAATAVGGGPLGASGLRGIFKNKPPSI